MTRRLVPLLLALWVILVVADALLDLAQDDTLDALFAPVLVVFAGVGALLAARLPGNAIGWLLLAVVLLVGATEVAQGIYVDRQDELRTGALADGLLWFDNWAFQLWLGLIGVMVPLLFPDGRLPSPRWRLFGALSVATIAAGVLGAAFGAATLEWGSDGSVANPLQLGGPAGDVLAALGTAALPLSVAIHVGALGAVIVRLRRSHGIRRLQMKWFAFAMALLVAGLVVATLASLAQVDVLAIAGWMLFLVALGFVLPVAIGVAILRHRLYEIDLVINRALVYGALTLTLAATYLGLVLVVGLAVGESDLAVAASTLAVAALFRPARARIQAQVDRRFYRRRYDAARTLEAFGARLRDELVLEALATDLRGVVRESVQPTHVSLWLRGTP